MEQQIHKINIPRHTRQLHHCPPAMQNPPAKPSSNNTTKCISQAVHLLYLSNVLPMSLSVLMAIFFRWTWVSQYQNVAFWIRLELRMMKVVVTGAINRCTKLQSNRYHQQTNTLLFTDWMPFLSPSQQCQSTEQNVLPMSLSHTILTAIFQVNLG